MASLLKSVFILVKTHNSSVGHCWIIQKYWEWRAYWFIFVAWGKMILHNFKWTIQKWIERKKSLSPKSLHMKAVIRKLWATSVVSILWKCKIFRPLLSYSQCGNSSLVEAIPHRKGEEWIQPLTGIIRSFPTLLHGLTCLTNHINVSPNI